MATQEEVQNLVNFYAGLKNQAEDYQTNNKSIPAKLQQQMSYVENAVTSQFSGEHLSWLNQQVLGTRAHLREQQNVSETTRVNAIKTRVVDKSLLELTQNMNDGRGMTAEGIASIAVNGNYGRRTGKEIFDRQALEDAMPYLTTPSGKQFAKDFDDYAEKMDGLTQRYREDPKKGIKGLTDVGMSKDDVEHWEENGLKYELYNRWSEEDKDMDEFEDVEATEDEVRRADLICAMNTEGEQVWESPASTSTTEGQYDMDLQNEDSRHGDVARAMFDSDVRDNVFGGE